MRTLLAALLLAAGVCIAAHGSDRLLNQAVDVSRDFLDLTSEYFLVDRAATFDAASGTGRLSHGRYVRAPGVHFAQTHIGLEKRALNWFPPNFYAEAPELPFEVIFVSPRTVRLRIGRSTAERPSLMLLRDPARADFWRTARSEGSTTYTSDAVSVTITEQPWRIEFRDPQGRLLTRSFHPSDTASFEIGMPMPVGFVRRTADLERRFAATFTLAPDERLYGGGESFTRLNKRGQKLVLFIRDALSAQTADMYKPIPFFLSSAGYGMFVHTSAPVTLDLGHSYDGAATVFSGADELDLFFFFGTPKQILSEYTALVGRSPLPPLWSFGLWMSRITYKSEDEVRTVAAKLRERRIPADVIHLDTGWFEHDWRADYKFSPTRFPEPAKLLGDLRQQGFRVSLWQLPYFTPANPLHAEVKERGLAVRTPSGAVATEDAIVDFSNPEAVNWYKEQLAGLLRLGVSAIKVDFGEGAPLDGLYASGTTGWYEHNLYPLRYNQVAAEITKETTGDDIIWARSAWAGSQRFPLHWAGDAENTDSAMAATLRAGLSFGLSGFTFWSHDIGGFVKRSPAELYRRWLPFGMLTSHSRTHGAPPREPWEYGSEFEAEFRAGVEMKYRLMPYVLAQAQASARAGHPMLRALFFEFPDDPTSWFIEDQYMFGSDLLVAPLFTDSPERRVYLPPGGWIDYQTGRRHQGGAWHVITAGRVPIVVLVRDGALVPHIALAQSTAEMDWSSIELVAFSSGESARGRISLPGRSDMHEMVAIGGAKAWRVEQSPLKGRVRWTVRHHAAAAAQ